MDSRARSQGWLSSGWRDRTVVTLQFAALPLVLIWRSLPQQLAALPFKSCVRSRLCYLLTSRPRIALLRVLTGRDGVPISCPVQIRQENQKKQNHGRIRCLGRCSLFQAFSTLSSAPWPLSQALPLPINTTGTPNITLFSFSSSSHSLTTGLEALTTNPLNVFILLSTSLSRTKNND